MFKEVLAPATRSQDDPLNLAYIAAAPTRAAVVFDLVTSASNMFGGLWEAGAGAIHAENEALAWITGLLGWPETAGGTFVSGGTSGNHSALMTARETAKARRGGRPAGGWQLACTANAHSSIQSAAKALDVEIVEVPVDDRGHLTGAALRELCSRPIPTSSRSSHRPAPPTRAWSTTSPTSWTSPRSSASGCTSTAPTAARPLPPRACGTCSTASSAPTASSSTRTSGCSRRTTRCALVYREPELARAVHAQHASYLDHVDRESWNPSELALHLSRRARGLPLWFSLAVHGTDKYREAIERTLTTSREIADAIRASDHLALVREPELTVILFERIGWTDEQVEAWSQQAAHDGTIFCVPTTWRGRLVLRLAFVNPATDAAAVMQALRWSCRNRGRFAQSEAAGAAINPIYSCIW